MPQIIKHPSLGDLVFPDDMPDPQIRSEIERLQAQEDEAAKPLRSASMMRAMPVAGGGQMYPVPTPQEAARALATTVEMGAPIAGGLVAGPAGGALGAGAGQTLAQAIRMGAGLQREFKPTEALAATAFGALAPGAVQAAPTLMSGLAQMAKTGLGMGAGGAGIQYAKTFLEEGRAPSMEELAVPAALPAFLGAAGTGTGLYGGRMMDVAEQAWNNFGKLTRAGIKEPTLGQLMPEKYAGMEARAIATEPTGKEAQRLQKTYEDISSGLHRVSPTGEYEPANVMQQMVARAEERNLPAKLAQLGPQVEQAQLQVKAATDAMAAQRNLADKTVLAEQRRLAAEALDLSLESAVKNARQLAAQRLSGGPSASPAVAAQEFKAKVFDPAVAAYDSHFSNLYGVFDATSPVFDAKPFRSMAEAAFEQAGKPLPAAMRNLLEGDKVSWNSLRNVREQLLDLGAYDPIQGKNVTRAYREAAGGYTRELNNQADVAFGVDMGDQFRRVNTDYGRYKSLLKAPGMDVLEAKIATDDAVTNLVSGIKESGLQDYRMKNLMAFLDNLTQPQTARIMAETERGVMPTAFAAQIHPELAAAVKGHVLDLVRGNILNEVSERGRVIPEKLIGTLNKIGNNAGALEAIGFGSVGQADELAKLFAKYPSANQLTVDQWRDLWASPAFNKSWESGQTIASYIRPIVKESEINNNVLRAVFLEQQGKVQEAAEALMRARYAAGSSASELAGVQAKYNQAKLDPVFQVFQRPEGAQLSPTSMRALQDTLFNPSASSPVNNKFVQDLTDAMRKNFNRSDAELLKQIQKEYLTNYLSEFGQAGPYERIKVGKLAALTRPDAVTASKGEIARARALLDSDQFDFLVKAADAAQVMAKAEAYGAAAPAKELGRVGSLVKDAYYGVADLIRRGQYNAAVDAIVDAKTFTDKMYAMGDWVKSAGEVARASAGPLTSQAMREREQQRRRQQVIQGPQSLMQFAPSR